MTEMQEETLTRVTFREGQVLYAADLNDHSAYLRSLRRRHDAGAHGWGIVDGLLLEREPGGFVVGPGLAWDGFGRTLLLADEQFRPWRLQENGSVTDLFEHLGAPAVDVWLLYDHHPQNDAGRCRDRQPTRWRETARLCYTPAPLFDDRPDFDPRRPWGLTPADRQYGPHLEPADDPARLWPVYLGTLYLIGDDPQVDTVRRPYAGLVGQRVLSASRRALPEEEGAESAPAPVPRVELLLDGERRLPQPRRFALRVRDEAGQPVERLAVERPGRVTMRGHVILLNAGPVADRTEASDFILPEPDPAFGPEDICDPDAVACLLQEFEYGQAPQEQALQLLQQTATAAEQTQIALLGLNSLLLQPQLYTQPVLARATLRPKTAQLLEAQLLHTMRQFDERQHFRRAASIEIDVPPAQNDVLRQLLEQSLGPQLLQDEALLTLLQQGQLHTLLRMDDVRHPFQHHTLQLVKQQVQEADRVQVAFNRLLLEDFYGQALCRRARLHAYTIGFAPLPEPPTTARPWTIYRTDVPADEETGQPQRRQLRVEFGEFGEPQHPERSCFSVGYHHAGAFHACLNIDEACTLHLSGNLSVTGDLIRRPSSPGAGGAPGTGGAPGLPDVSQPSLEEALAQQPAAPSTLDVAIQDIDAEAGELWSYNVRLENTGQETVRWVLVLENFEIDGGTASDTAIVGGLAQLEPEESEVVPVAHLSPLPDPALQVAIQLTVMAFTPDSRVMYESEDDIAPIVP